MDEKLQPSSPDAVDLDEAKPATDYDVPLVTASQNYPFLWQLDLAKFNVVGWLLLLATFSVFLICAIALDQNAVASVCLAWFFFEGSRFLVNRMGIAISRR